MHLNQNFDIMFGFHLLESARLFSMHEEWQHESFNYEATFLLYAELAIEEAD